MNDAPDQAPATAASLAIPADAALRLLSTRLQQWATDLGFSALGVSDLDVADAAGRLRVWCEAGYQGDMSWMVRHAPLRADPRLLLPQACRAICVRMDYLPMRTSVGPGASDWIAHEQARLADGESAVVSVYARGRDYHKVMRQRLQALATRMQAAVGAFGFRVCADSAPVFEVELARRAGIGWRGKHTLLLARDAGSTFFLGEILTDLPLPVDEPVSDHCGSCSRCIDVCPTRAIVAPYQLDARRCISYLTIEHAGDIPEALRPAMGNRVYGCDDCQLACPWNRYARVATVSDFDVRHGLDDATLVSLFAWTEAQFRERHAGSAILRIGYERWQRNLAVALGNAPSTTAVLAALRSRVDAPSALVRRHVAWALERHADVRPEKRPGSNATAQSTEGL